MQFEMVNVFLEPVCTNCTSWLYGVRTSSLLFSYLDLVFTILSCTCFTIFHTLIFTVLTCFYTYLLHFLCFCLQFFCVFIIFPPISLLHISDYLYLIPYLLFTDFFFYTSHCFIYCADISSSFFFNIAPRKNWFNKFRNISFVLI